MKNALPFFKKTALIFLLHAMAFTAYGQKQNNIWYFGDSAGLDFNSGVPVVLQDGQIETYEGCASIADKDGHLLFYTDGSLVYNRNHQIMTQGTGLRGNSSCTQSVCIISEADTLFYIFSNNSTTENLYTGSLYYSKVKMNNPTDLGSVTSKNNKLADNITEKLVAIKDSLGTTFWVVTHKWGTDEYLAFHGDDKGINAIPVISKIGAVIDNAPGEPNKNAGDGYLKFSPNGKKLAAVHEYGIKKIELFDFNHTTGVLSNAITINGYDGYGVEFSPDGSKLYVADLDPITPVKQDYFYLSQFNLQAGSPTAIANSVIHIDSLSTNFSDTYGALQLAGNGKIYVAKEKDGFNIPQRFLAVINFPNRIGKNCAYRDTAVILKGGCYFGLPNFTANYFDFPSITYLVSCGTLSVDFDLSQRTGIDSVQWNFGDTGSVNNIITAFNLTHLFSKAGIFKVRAILFSNNKKDTIFTTVYLEDVSHVLGNDTTVCDGGPLKLQINNKQVTLISWSDNSTDSVLTITQSGTYWVDFFYNCKMRDSIVVKIFPALHPDFSYKKIPCTKQIKFTNLSTDTTKSFWDFGDSTFSTDNNPIHTFDSSGKYTIKLIAYRTNTICVDSIIKESEIKIDDNKDSLRIPNVFTPNGDGINDYFEIQNGENPCIIYKSLAIYSRWGDRVFEASGTYEQLRWNGTKNGSDLGAGVYFYVLEGDDHLKKTGNITLLRK